METRASRRSGAVAAAAEAEWTAMLAELVEWKEENGGSMASLPTVTDEDGGSKKRGSKKPKISKLGKWVTEMRKEKKEGRLSKDKEDKLNEIGFEWGGAEGETMGASKIATAEGESSADHVADGEGEVKNQKKRRRNPSRNAKKLHNDFIEEAFFQGELTQEDDGDTAAKSQGGDADGAKKAKKRKVGDQQWEQKFEELVRFKAQYGHFRIPVKEMPLLKYWAQNQKITYRKGKLSDERRARLESVGFHWGKQRKGDTPQKGSDRQAVAAKTPSAAHGRLTSASGGKRQAGEGEVEGDGSSGDEDEGDEDDEDEEQQEVATTESAASSKKKAAKEGNATTTTSSSASSSSTATSTTPSNGASNTAARGAANSSSIYGQPKPTAHTTAATHSNSSYIHPPTTSQFGSGKDYRMYPPPPYLGGPHRGMDASSMPTAVPAGSSNMNGPAASMVDRFLTVREAREYIFSRIEVLERRQEETHRHMLELRQAFKGMERFIMQHFAREREMAERTRSMWTATAAPQPLYGHESQPPPIAAGVGGKGYPAYPTSAPVAAGYPYYPQQAQPPVDPTKERERMVSAGYLPPQQHQPHAGPYPYSYPPPAGVGAPMAMSRTTSSENPYARHVMSPSPSNNAFARSPTAAGPTATSSSPSPLSHLNAALGALTQSPPPTPAAPSPPVGLASQNMHGAPHMSPALGPSGAYTGVLPHGAHNPYQSLPPHAGHPQARSQQPQPHHPALPPHHATATSASTMPASHQPGFYPPPHRASPVIGSPMPGGCSPEAVQTPEAHGLHFPRTPNAPSVTSVTPIPPSIVHQYPPPEEVAPTLSPPRPRLGDFTLPGIDPVGAAFPFLDENDEDDGSGGGGTGAVSGATLSRLDHLRHHHATAGEEDGGATETDENGEELLKQLDTFC